MADDVSTVQIGDTASLVDAALTIDNTLGTVSATVDLLSGGVQIPVTVTTETLGADGAITIAGTTVAGATVDIAFTQNATTASVTTDVGGLAVTTTEAATIVCFCSGTLIRTVRGDVAVEHLAVGDLATTAQGEPRSIRWLGHRRIDCRRHLRPHEVMPVRISAHAFGENRPSRDLIVSPGHSLCVDVVGEVLIPASSLINGTTICQEDIDHVTYWHVELEAGHDILLAENMPAESYLDMGNRAFFAEHGVVGLEASPDALVPTHADFCRPFHQKGALVEVVRAQLSARAQQLGWKLEEQGLGDVHLLVDDKRIDPQVRGLSVRFTLPADAREVWLVSNTSVPAAIHTASLDTRVLGLPIRGLAIDEGFGAPRTIAADDPRLCVGFHDVEGDGDATWRWTAGRARLPASLWEGVADDAFLRIDLAGPALPRCVAPAAVQIEVPHALLRLVG